MPRSDNDDLNSAVTPCQRTAAQPLHGMPYALHGRDAGHGPGRLDPVAARMGTPPLLSL